MDQLHQKWICGRLEAGKPCRAGPDARGRCLNTFECVPGKKQGRWHCGRPPSKGGPCKRGPRPNGKCCKRIPPCKPVKTLRAKRETISKLVAIFVAGIVIFTIAYASDTQLLMPGPVTTAHSSLTKCGDCHSNIGEEQFSWLGAVFSASNPHKDSKACLTCHKMGDSPLSPHGTPSRKLQVSTKRLEKVAASASSPMSAHLRNIIFSAGSRDNGNVFCATCHKEHKGRQFNLTAMANVRCQACHTVQFSSFQQGHPEFSNYPFKRRTRIFFDHSSHFAKHFPKIKAENELLLPAIPKVCIDCHTTAQDKRVMSVKPFKQVCFACHVGQIVGTERASGPKGIALLSLPGIDVETLREKNINIGEWPTDSEAEITPFMKLLIGWDENRRRLLSTVGKLDLLDLSEASNEEIAAVQKFVWEVKDLIHMLSTSGKSNVMSKLGPATGTSIDQTLLAKLIATLPRDVLINAQREWLPNLDAEMKRYKPVAQNGWTTTTKSTVKSGAKKQPGTPANLNSDEAVRFVPNSQKISDIAKLFERQDREKGRKFAQNQEPADTGNWRIDPFGRLIKGGEQPPPPAGQPSGETEQQPTDTNKPPAEDAQESPSASSSDPVVIDNGSGATGQADNRPSDNRQQPDGQAEGQPSDNVQKQPTGQSNNQPSAAVQKQPAGQANNRPSATVKIEASGQTDDLLSDEQRKQSAKERAALLSDEERKQFVVETNNRPADANERQPAKQPVQQPTKQPVQRSVKQADDRPSEEDKKQSANQTDNRPPREVKPQPVKQTEARQSSNVKRRTSKPSNAPVPAEDRKQPASKPRPVKKTTVRLSPAKKASVVPSDGIVDAESWAEFGGWYRQDFSILYRPTGHADGFLRAWLDFSGQLYNAKEENLASPVFDLLTSKDAQGQCTKCHSVDIARGETRRVNWGTSSVSSKKGRFTSFIHEPHLSILSEKGCLTCHDLNNAAKYQNSYKGHNPAQFESNFKPVQQKRCSACHGNNVSRDDCLLCHKYHVNDVTSPLMKTRLPK